MWFSFVEICIQAWGQVRAYLMRSLLTSLGVIISVTGVIAISGTMQGLEIAVNTQLKGLGSDIIMVQAAYSENALGRREWNALSSQVKGIKNLVATQQIVSRFSMSDDDNLAVRFGDRRQTVTVASATAMLPTLYHLPPLQGRFLMDSDEAAHQRVCVISAELIALMGLPENPVGVKLYFANFSLSIVGVMPKTSKGGIRQLAQLYIPFALAQELQSQSRSPWQFAFQLRDTSQREMRLREVRQVLRMSLGSAPDVQDDFKITDAAQLRAANDEIMQMISVILLLLVSISLVVGAIGIMNVMLVAVTQRTREIGVQRALGATQWHIRLQFLVEASTISVLGAVVGVVLGLLISNMIVAFTFEDVHTMVVPIWAILSAVGVALLVGILAGAWPAVRAAQLNPIDALAVE